MTHVEQHDVLFLFLAIRYKNRQSHLIHSHINQVYIILWLVCYHVNCPSCGTEMKGEVSEVNDPKPGEGKKRVVNRECPNCGSRIERKYATLAEVKRRLYD